MKRLAISCLLLLLVAALAFSQHEDERKAARAAGMKYVVFTTKHHDGFAPGPDGEWQQGAYDLLAEIGGWLEVNGEGIYGTRALVPYAEGWVRMTRGKDGSGYFVYLAGEQESELPAEVRVASHHPAAGAAVTLLGSKTPLQWRTEGAGFVALVPPALRANPPSRYAWVLKVSRISD